MLSTESYRNFKEISEKFRGNFIKHNNECIHIHPNPRPKIYENFRNFGEISSNNNECIHIHPNPRSEIYENFRNFSEISEIITSSDTWGLG